MELTFEDGTGLTSGDAYNLIVGSDGSIMSWSYTLQDGGQGTWLWQSLEDCGMGLRFHTRKYNQERRVAIIFPVVEMSKYMEPEVFEPK